MRDELTRRDALESLLVLGLGAQVGTGVATARRGTHGGKNRHRPGEPTLNRFATTVAAAEFTGIFLSDDGQLFFNVQHPGEEADEDYRPGAVGAVTNANVTELPADFESVQPPEGAATHVRTARGDYQVLAEGGDRTAGGENLGVPYTVDGEPMTEGANPDFNGFVPADGDGEGYLFTNWETQPGMVSRLHVQQSRGAGYWRVLEKRNLDFRPVEGTWNNCFGTVTPWDTPLTSEEYEPDAATWFDPDETGYGDPEQRFREYLGEPGNPYRYGYIVEITAPRSDDPTPVKHFAMGRFSHENAVVMPDERTVYMSDDGTGTVFFKFEADEPGDLSSGTLYAAKASQGRGTDPVAVGFELEWIELGHATDGQVEEWIAEYDRQEPNADADYLTDEDVQAWAAGNADDDRAAFLESRRAATAVGATNEFRKMEGVNVKSGARPGDYLYVAMSEVNETMLANADTGDGDDDSRDDIRLAGNDYGAVYRMELGRDYDVDRMEPVLVGGPDANVCGGCPYDAKPNSKSTVCQDCAFNPATDRGEETGSESESGASGDEKGLNRATSSVTGLAGAGMASLTESSPSVDPENAIANPDNLVVMPDGRVLVGEDSGRHSPNMLWVYDPGSERGRGRSGGRPGEDGRGRGRKD